MSAPNNEKKFGISVIPGDGIGNEVVPEGLRVLEAVGKKYGFDYGFAGHLTVRDPERPELYWTNPMCVHFDKVKMSNLILVDHAGKVIEGMVRNVGTHAAGGIKLHCPAPPHSRPPAKRRARLAAARRCLSFMRSKKLGPLGGLPFDRDVR